MIAHCPAEYFCKVQGLKKCFVLCCVVFCLIFEDFFKSKRECFVTHENYMNFNVYK